MNSSVAAKTKILHKQVSDSERLKESIKSLLLEKELEAEQENKLSDQL
ncbi:MAG: hypothetical protein AB7O96_15900 [Pseudobdellovibrionaceae bacterium]